MDRQPQELIPYPDEFLRELGSLTVVFARLELTLWQFLQGCPQHTDCRGAQAGDDFSKKVDVFAKHAKHRRELGGFVQELKELNDFRCDLIHGIAIRFSKADERFTFLNKRKKGDRVRRLQTRDVQTFRIRAQLLTLGLVARASEQSRDGV